jgi:hypothetical protein
MNKISINKNMGLLLAAGLTFVLSACVTINIYFPAAAAEKAADKIIDEVWQLKDAESKKDGEPKKDGETQPVEPKPAPSTESKPAGSTPTELK